MVKQAAVGAPAAMVGGQIETAIEEKRFPTYDEYLNLAKSGAITGAIGGAAEGTIAGAELSKEAKGLWKRLAGKSEQELAETIGQIRESGSSAERKAASEIFDEIGQRTGILRSKAIPGGFGSEETAIMAGSRPTAGIEAPAGAVEGTAKSAQESAQIMQAAARRPELASQLTQARAEELQQAMRGGQLAGPESTAFTGPYERTQLSFIDTRRGQSARERARMEQALGIKEESLPTTEDIIQEFQTVPGIKGRAGVRELGLASAGGGVGLAAADIAAGKNAPAEGDIGVVELEHPYLGVLRYTPEWSKEEIQKDLQQKEIEYAKIQAASPQLALREKFEAAATPAEKLSVLQEFGPMGTAMGLRMAGGAAAGYAPPIARPFIGMGTEAAALAVEDKPITAGKMGRAAAEYTVAGKSGELAKNALKFLGINIAGEQIEEFIDRGGAITLDAAARRAAEGGGQALLMKALDKGKLAAAQKAAISKSDSELIRTLTLANEGGLVLDPVMFSRTAARKGAMKVAGGSKEFHNYASIVNEPRILKLAKEDIGIEGALNNNAFITRRLELGEAYRDVAKVSPAAESAVNEWKRMNDLARDAFRRVQSKADTEALDAARAYKEKANAAFDTMVTEAKKLPGGDDLILRLRDAQKKIAKTYAVEAATNTATGRIDNAQVWGFMWDQKIPFDGNMETLARLARSMPEVMADTSKISIGKTLPQGKMAAAVAMTGVPAAARMAMGSGPAQALTFLPS